MSGFDLQQRLAMSDSRVPVILVTADESPTTRERAEKSGCSAFLRKPLDAQNLIPALQRAMNVDGGSAK
jgi:FixJ family two-component response regulator